MRRAWFIVALSIPVAAGLLMTGGTTAATEKRPTCLGQKATMVGTARNDVLRGTQKRDVIVALGGDDRVNGRGGGDVLCGGAGDDLLDGGGGRNRLDGGTGLDHCFRGTGSKGCELPPPPLPSVSGLTIDGDPIALKDFRGRAVFVNVWAYW